MEELRSLGPAAILIVLVLREVREMISKRSGPTDSLHQEIGSMVRDLHSWHSLEDEDGVKRWYLPVHLRQRLDRIERKLDALSE